MASISSDVAPPIASMIIRHWQAAPVWQKLAYVNELNAALQVLALSDLRRRYPTDTDTQLQRRLAARWLGPDLADRVYGPIHEDASAAH